MKQNQLKIIQTFGELLIPILGYFIWNWNFYFIALFYYLDLIANTFFVHFKLKKIDSNLQLDGKIIGNYIYFFISLIAIFFIGILLTENLISNFDLKQQSIDFFMLKDMGIPQGFVLLPLVFYAAYMQYKMDFIMTNKQLNINKKKYLQKHALGNTITLGLLGIAYALSLFFQIPETFAVLILIGLTSAYSFFAKRA